MKKMTLKLIASNYKIVPILTMILLSGCASGENPTKIQVTSSFLDCVIDEWEKSVHGECTKEVIKDWVAQNDA